MRSRHAEPLKALRTDQAQVKTMDRQPEAKSEFTKQSTPLPYRPSTEDTL